MKLEWLRKTYHQAICRHLLGQREGISCLADSDNATSIQIAQGLMAKLGFRSCPEPPSDPKAGRLFTSLTRDYLRQAFRLVEHLRPGEWLFALQGDGVVFDQYEHLSELAHIQAQVPASRRTQGGYLLFPDILFGRSPISDHQVGETDDSSDADIATLTPLRAGNYPDDKPILHAGISCNWTLGGNGTQYARSETLNLIRNRKGQAPYIAVVTAEPVPTRIAALALGTGDLDCVYHFALPELRESIEESENQDQLEMLDTLIQGRRLRDISDLPFDLAT